MGSACGHGDASQRPACSRQLDPWATLPLHAPIGSPCPQVQLETASWQLSAQQLPTVMWKARRSPSQRGQLWGAESVQERWVTGGGWGAPGITRKSLSGVGWWRAGGVGGAAGAVARLRVGPSKSRKYQLPPRRARASDPWATCWLGDSVVTLAVRLPNGTF